jgi:hypothetical protein
VGQRTRRRFVEQIICAGRKNSLKSRLHKADNEGVPNDHGKQQALCRVHIAVICRQKHLLAVKQRQPATPVG